MIVRGDWALLFTTTPVPKSAETEWRCTWCGWTVRVRTPIEQVPSHECPGPQPRIEPKA
jgi:rubrerythrin